MKHKHEIKYWAEHPDKTKVWFKSKKRDKWLIDELCGWYSEFIYIVDDEWAELRKAQVDGKQLEYYIGYRKEEINDEVYWVNSALSRYDMENTLPEHWRIKPEKEPIYEYQWICKTHLGKYFIPNSYFVKKEAVEGYICDNYTVVEPYEPSKRERKRK